MDKIIQIEARLAPPEASRLPIDETEIHTAAFVPETSSFFLQVPDLMLDPELCFAYLIYIVYMHTLLLF